MELNKFLYRYKRCNKTKTKNVWYILFLQDLKLNLILIFKEIVLKNRSEESLYDTTGID